MEISAVAVFLQGLLSFLSPCVLPLLPVYLGFIMGDETKGGKRLLKTLLFVVGISTAFFALGAGATALGAFFEKYGKMFSAIGGVFIIFMGLYQLGFFGKTGALSKDRHFSFDMDRLSESPFSAFLLGFLLSFGWTPCVGPVLAGILAFAASKPGQGFFYTALYTAGFAVPFLLAGIFTEKVLRFLDKHRKVMAYTVKIGGVLLVVMGTLLFKNAVMGAENKEAPQKEVVETEKDAEEESDTYPAPEFTLKDQYGETHSLSDYKGKTVFLNFWATWCPPCRGELPDIEKLYQEKGEDIAVLGVASPGIGREQDAKGIAAFLKDNGYTYPVLMDETGDVFASYGVRAYPTTVIIDPEGHIKEGMTGALTYEMMEDMVK